MDKNVSRETHSIASIMILYVDIHKIAIIANYYYGYCTYSSTDKL